jgi:DNA excision repair protein ERCC-5
MFHYSMKAIENAMGIDRDDLISLAQLLGSDYAQGVNGIGIVLAMEIIAEFRGISFIPQFEQFPV